MILYINAQFNGIHDVFDPILELQQGQGWRNQTVDEVVDAVPMMDATRTPLLKTNIRLTREVFQ